MTLLGDEQKYRFSNSVSRRIAEDLFSSSIPAFNLIACGDPKDRVRGSANNIRDDFSFAPCTQKFGLVKPPLLCAEYRQENLAWWSRSFFFQLCIYEGWNTLTSCTYKI